MNTDTKLIESSHHGDSLIILGAGRWLINQRGELNTANAERINSEYSALNAVAEAAKELVALYEAIEAKPGHAPAHYNAVKALSTLKTIQG